MTSTSIASTAASTTALTIDGLAKEIRRLDGNHSMGAGALAEALMPFLRAQPASPAPLTTVDEIMRIARLSEGALTIQSDKDRRNLIEDVCDALSTILRRHSDGALASPKVAPERVPARLRHAIDHAKVAGTLLMDAKSKAPETWRGWYDDALNHIDIVQKDLEVLAARLAAPAPTASTPKQRDPLREAAILAIGALERTQHATEGDRLEAADALRDALALTRSARGTTTTPTPDPLQNTVYWLKEAIVGCTVADLQTRLLIDFNRARRLFDATPTPTRPVPVPAAPTKAPAQEIQSIEGTIRFLRGSAAEQVCICCPAGSGHIYSRGVDWDDWETNHPAHFGKGPDTLVSAFATDKNQNEGKRVRVTVEVLDAQGAAA